MGENKPIREIETTIDEIEGLVINIGRVYENKVTKLLVDLSSTLVEHPNATASLVVRQPNWQSYPATVTLNGMTLEWLITDAEIGLQSVEHTRLIFPEISEVLLRIHLFSSLLHLEGLLFRQRLRSLLLRPKMCLIMFLPGRMLEIPAAI